MRAASLIAVLCLLAVAAPVRAQWSLDLEAGLIQDSNLGNSRFADDIVSDHALTASVAATRTTFLDDDDTFSWGGRAATETYARYGGVNNLSLGGNAAFRHKVGLGAYAPWLRAAWSSSRLSYVDKVRDGWLHEADFSAGRRLDERWSLSAGYRIEWRQAATQPQAEPGVSGDAFSGRAHSLRLGADYAASEGTLVSIGGFARRGDVLAFSGDDDHVLAVAKAAANDGAFGAGRYAYRLLGTTYGLGIGLGIALGPNSRIDVKYQRQVTHGEGDNNYAKNIETISWGASF